MQVAVIVLAAGKGERLSRQDAFSARGGIPIHLAKIDESGNSRISKPLVKINGKPLIVYCLQVFSQHPSIKSIIVVANAFNKKDIAGTIAKYRISKVKDIVSGGRRRQDSVRLGLGRVDKPADLVLVHDSARPFVDNKMVTLAIKEAGKYGAAIVGVPVKATIKKIKNQKSKIKIVEETLDRKRLWEAQTPQVFKKDLILRAYQRFGNIEATDDASLVEKLGQEVRLVPGSYNNIKITTPEDLVLAEAIAKTL